MRKSLTRKQIKKNRTWNHFKWWVGDGPHFIDNKEVVDYEPEKWRDAFERYQSYGPKALTTEEHINIKPLLDGQRQKEICLNGHVAECMEWWAHHRGWIWPLRDSLLRGKYDRLTRLAMLRMMRSMSEDIVGFFERHPGIEDDVRQRHFSTYAS